MTFQQFLRWWVSVVTFLIPLVLILLIWVVILAKVGKMVMIMLMWMVILAKLCKERASKEVKVMDSQQPTSSRLSSQKRRWHTGRTKVLECISPSNYPGKPQLRGSPW